MNCDFIAKYQVKIVYDKNNASGVIVKLDEFPNHFFVFTAKHTFGDILLSINKVKIYYQDNLMEAISFITLKLDIVVFVFENEAVEEISRLETIKISQTENDFIECAFSGYPNNVDSDYCEKANYHQIVNKEENLYRISPEKNTDTFNKKGLNNSKGYSGSGLFIKKNNKYELLGIIKEHEKDKSAFHYIALASLKDEVIEKVSVQCGILNEIGYNEESIGEITLKTVPIEVDGKILNVSVYPVTFAEYDLFCEDTNNEKINTYMVDNRDRYPVVKITLEKATEYSEWLSAKANKNYRLPTSMEWESIAFQNMPKENYDEYIWHKNNSNNVTHQIGIKKAGLMGLFDLFGNIEEICSDNLTKGYSFKNSLKVITNIRKAKILLPSFTSNETGFRIVYE